VSAVPLVSIIICRQIAINTRIGHKRYLQTVRYTSGILYCISVRWLQRVLGTCYIRLQGRRIWRISTLVPWIRRLLVPPEYWYLSLRQHSVTSQKTVLFIVRSVTTWDLTFCCLVKISSMSVIWNFDITKYIAVGHYNSLLFVSIMLHVSVLLTDDHET